MALQFVLGHSGTGKTEWIYERLGKTEATPSRSTILIVPEQSTLQVQGEFLDRLDGRSMMAVEILSFQRLAFRVSDYLGIAGKTLLDDYGQQMLLRHLIDQDKGSYPLLARNCKRPGYVSELKHLLAELERYEIEAGQLNGLSEQLKRDALGGLLPVKLDEVAKLYESYRASVGTGFLTVGTMLDLLKKRIKDLTFVKDAQIYIDGFYGFTPIQYAIIRELLAAAKQVTVVMAIDRHAYEAKVLPESHLFWEVKETLHKVRMLAYEERIEELEAVCFFDEQPVRFRRPALLHIQKHLFQYPLKQYDQKPSGLIVCRSSSVKKEVSFVLDTVWHLVREQALRFKDIAVLCGSTEAYERLISVTFKKGGVPFHLDAKHPLRDHPLAKWMLSLLEIAAFGFRYETVFQLLKNPINGFDEESVDLLENYAIAYGLKSEKGWRNAFSRKIPQLKLDRDHPLHVQMLEELNEQKDNMLSPILDAVSRLKGKMDVSKRLQVLVALFEENEMEIKIEAMADAYAAEGRLDIERAYRQAYGMMIELFDQMHEMLGDEISTAGEFKELLEAGLDKQMIGVVPAGLDEIVVGDIHHSRIGEKRALFVLGVNEGVVPAIKDKASLITDRDRALLQDRGLTMAPTAEKQLFREPLNILMNLLKATERLYISHTRTDSDNSTARPSHIIHMLLKMFPACSLVDVDREMEGKIIASMPEAAFGSLVEGLEKYGDKEDFRQSYLWFSEHKSFRGRLENGLMAASEYAADEPIETGRAMELYGSVPNYSVTRLERYAECPFRFFVDYGLAAEERKEYAVDPKSVGSLFHAAIERFTSRMIEEGNDWNALDKETRDALVDGIIDRLLKEDELEVYLSTARNRHLVERVRRMTKRALWAVAYQISKGDFKPVGAEMKFKGDDDRVKSLTISLENGRKMRLNGIIDRLDSFKMGEDTYITVLDYKSGTRKVDLTELYHGIQMQLLTYLNAAQEMKAAEGGGKVLPAGAFYFHIDDPFVDVDEGDDDHTIEGKILEKMKLDGLILKDRAVVAHLDKAMTGKSDVMNVSLNMNGDFSKKRQAACEGGIRSTAGPCHEEDEGDRRRYYGR